MDHEARRTGRALARVLAVVAIIYGAFNLGVARELANLSGALFADGGSTAISGTLLVLAGLLLLSVSRRGGRE